MNDFGHLTGRFAGGGFIDGWGSGPFVIEAGGKTFRFEDSDMFGPSRVNKDGEISKNPFFGQSSPFWEAWRKWKDQGRRVAEDGITCLWDDGRPPAAPGRAGGPDGPEPQSVSSPSGRSSLTQGTTGGKE